jgi:hypothetical protein
MSFLDGAAFARLGVVIALSAGVGTAACTATPPAPLAPPGLPASTEGPPPEMSPAVPGPTGASPRPVESSAEPWDTLVRCETGGDWHADTGNGHQGGLQLTARTWGTYGGAQFAARADEASREQQIIVGERLRADQGWEAWSGCSEQIGLT